MNPCRCWRKSTSAHLALCAGRSLLCSLGRLVLLTLLLGFGIVTLHLTTELALYSLGASAQLPANVRRKMALQLPLNTSRALRTV